jgi:GxxExxY protein
LTWRIVGAAMQVHKYLGPGLLERTYATCLRRELGDAGLPTQVEVEIPIEYKGMLVDGSYRADLIVDSTVLLEIKAVEQILPIHCMQTLTYLKLSKLPVALLINFNVPSLKSGIRRFANTARAGGASPDRPALALPPSLAG